MQHINLAIPEVILLSSKVFGDDRGFFMESYNQEYFDKIVGYRVNFVQDNHSKSRKGVLRGLHFQASPMSQGKLVRVISGEVFDVAVDIRKDSPNYGKWVGEILSAENKSQLWIPEGFAHGFITLSEESEFLYKTTNFYSPQHEASIAYDDTDLNINWMHEGEIIVSEKDRAKSVKFKDIVPQ